MSECVCDCEAVSRVEKPVCVWSVDQRRRRVCAPPTAPHNALPNQAAGTIAQQHAKAVAAFRR